MRVGQSLRDWPQSFIITCSVNDDAAAGGDFLRLIMAVQHLCIRRRGTRRPKFTNQLRFSRDIDAD
jgi:hypothetical protein